MTAGLLANHGWEGLELTIRAFMILGLQKGLSPARSMSWQTLAVRELELNTGTFQDLRGCGQECLLPGPCAKWLFTDCRWDRLQDSFRIYNLIGL